MAIVLPTFAVPAASKVDSAQGIAWKIEAQDGFVVIDLGVTGKQKKIQAPHLTISLSNDQIMIDGMPTSSDYIRIDSLAGPLTYKGKMYEGSLLIRAEKNKLLLVHEIPDEIDEIDEQVDVPKAENSSSMLPLDKKLYHVRVLLDSWEKQGKNSLAGNSHWTLECAHGFCVKEKNGKKLSKNLGTELVIGMKHGKLFINNVRYEGEQLYIIPEGDAITFNDNCYQGAFIVARNNGEALLMNSLDLEDYVFSVLRTESWPGWPLEINKVFAIACRSYAIAMIVRSKNSKLPYHIKNTNVHQTYTGFHENPIVKSAVEQTRGIFLSYDNKPIIAMFDGCCGGVIPAGIKDFNFSGAPYLARPYACTYCRDCKLYSWQAEYQSQKLAQLLKKGAPQLQKIRDIKIAKKDKAGLVQQVAIKDGKRTATLTGKQIYSMLKDVKSYCFTVHKKSDSIIFNGRGYGHHLGLCQWGAREMVRRGKGHREILLFYYPNTTFMTLA